jgi:hypothetical protein
MTFETADFLTETPTMMFANLFSMLKLETLCEIIEDAYFHPATCGTARRLLAYGVLFNLFTWFSIAPWSGIDRKTLTEYVQLRYLPSFLRITSLIVFRYALLGKAAQIFISLTSANAGQTQLEHIWKLP